MKSTLSFFFVSFLFTSCIMYQSPANRGGNANPYKDKFADKLEPGSTLLESTFLSTFEKTADGKFLYKEYYPDTRQLIVQQYFLDKNQGLAEGNYNAWWDDGSPSAEGLYNNGKRQGEWSLWSGEYKSIGKYNNGLQEGLWIGYNPKGDKISETTYVAGKKNGPFKTWTNKGELKSEGTYLDDKIATEKVLKAETYDTDDPLKMVDIKPHFPGCASSKNEEEKRKCADMEMLKFIYTNIKYPPLARENDIQGTAYVQFVVEKNGSVSNIKTIRGITNEIKTECERVVRMMPSWEPGLQDGKPVRVLFTLPVKFKLE